MAFEGGTLLRQLTKNSPHYQFMPPGENQEFANDAAAYFWYVALGRRQNVTRPARWRLDGPPVLPTGASANSRDTDPYRQTAVGNEVTANGFSPKE